MKKDIIIFFVTIGIISIGFLWRRNFQQKKANNLINLEEREFFVLSSEEEKIANDLRLGGVDETSIQNAIKQRRQILSNLNLTPTINPCLEDENSIFGGRSKNEVLSLALSEGASANDLKEISAMYDLICYGKTDIEISQPVSGGASENSPKSEIELNCHKDREKYETCLTEYNTKIAEYQSCLSCKENEEFGCALACRKPHNNCNQYKPGLLCN